MNLSQRKSNRNGPPPLAKTARDVIRFLHNCIFLSLIMAALGWLGSALLLPFSLPCPIRILCDIPPV